MLLLRLGGFIRHVYMGCVLLHPASISLSSYAPVLFAMYYFSALPFPQKPFPPVKLNMMRSDKKERCMNCFLAHDVEDRVIPIILFYWSKISITLKCLESKH